jgi:glycosyltransferase involved in cell wall biosynthesis
MAERLGLEDAVVFAGPRNPDQLADLYSRASVVVSPSLGECLSTVVLEAMCCGCAVVATDVGGIREQLPPGRGLIVPPGDPEKLAAAICRFLSDPVLREQSGNAAKKHALSTYTIPSMIDRHIALYETLAHRQDH